MQLLLYFERRESINPPREGVRPQCDQEVSGGAVPSLQWAICISIAAAAVGRFLVELLSRPVKAGSIFTVGHSEST